MLRYGNAFNVQLLVDAVYKDAELFSLEEVTSVARYYKW